MSLFGDIVDVGVRVRYYNIIRTLLQDNQNFMTMRQHTVLAGGQRSCVGDGRQNRFLWGCSARDGHRVQERAQ